MFKWLDSETSDFQIRGAWNRLIRTIQIYIEHNQVTNNLVNGLARGDIVYASGNRQVAKAINTDPATAMWVGVMSDNSAQGENGVMRRQGYAYVHFKDGEVLVEGQPVYVSDTAGLATMVGPNSPAWTSRIGILGDGTEYISVDNPYAWVFLGHCCEPTVPDPQQ